MADLLASVPMPPRVAALARTPRGYPVPYVAAWTSEARHTVRPLARWNRPALFALGRPGEGDAVLGEMDMARQRECVALGRCQVCRTWLSRAGARWLAELYEPTDDGPLIREPWACPSCLAYALRVCPGLVGIAHRRPAGAPLRVLRVTAWTVLATLTSLEGLRADGQLAPDVPVAPGATAIGYFKLRPERWAPLALPDFLAEADRAG